MILLMKFDFDPPAGLRDIHALGRTDGRTHASWLDSHPISSPGAGELKANSSGTMLYENLVILISMSENCCKQWLGLTQQGVCLHLYTLADQTYFINPFKPN